MICLLVSFSFVASKFFLPPSPFLHFLPFFPFSLYFHSLPNFCSPFPPFHLSLHLILLRVPSFQTQPLLSSPSSSSSSSSFLTQALLSPSSSSFSSPFKPDPFSHNSCFSPSLSNRLFPPPISPSIPPPLPHFPPQEAAGSLDITAESDRGHLRPVGSAKQKLTIHATNETFSQTRDKMAKLEDANKQQQAKEIKPGLKGKRGKQMVTTSNASSSSSNAGKSSASSSASSKSSHYGTKPGHFETSKIRFPTSEGVSERVNE